MDGKFLDKLGMNTLWTKCKNYFVPNSRTVNGKALSSNITLNKEDVDLENVDNTSDADKPVSNAVQDALNFKHCTLVSEWQYMTYIDSKHGYFIYGDGSGELLDSGVYDNVGSDYNNIITILNLYPEIRDFYFNVTIDTESTISRDMIYSYNNLSSSKFKRGCVKRIQVNNQTSKTLRFILRRDGSNPNNISFYGYKGQAQIINSITIDIKPMSNFVFELCKIIDDGTILRFQIKDVTNLYGTNIGDTNTPTYILNGEITECAMSDYVRTSRTINGKSLSSNVTLSKGDVGLGDVDNTPDISKNVSRAIALGTNETTYNVGATDRPVYFLNGIPTQCSTNLVTQQDITDCVGSHWSQTLGYAVTNTNPSSNGIQHWMKPDSTPKWANINTVNKSSGSVIAAGFSTASGTGLSNSYQLKVLEQLTLSQTGNVGVLTGLFYPNYEYLYFPISNTASTNFMPRDCSEVRIEINLNALGGGFVNFTGSNLINVFLSGNELRFSSIVTFSNFSKGASYFFSIPLRML